MRRVVVTGSECTGKTTLARGLAARLGTVASEEHARAYAERAARALGAADVEPIARGQRAAEDAAAAGAAALGADAVVLDTDLLSTVAYARHYYGACPAWIEEEARRRRGDLYLLCAPDLPWAADGVRDRADRRGEVHALFAAVLEEFGAPVALVTGAGAARLDAAHAAVLARWRPGTRFA